MHVCVIGAGTAGLCGAKHSLAAGLDVTIFEQANSVGGTWIYTEDIGKDKYGLSVHTSMYKGLRTNLPKEIMGYPDFPIPAQDSSYISAADMLEFLNLYAKHFNLHEHIRFQHHVIRVRPFEESKWEVVVRDLPNDRVETLIFDAILVCNGHYHTPAYPETPGTDVYRGKQIHSHDYRCAEPFRDETVLVIGAGPSGVDLAFEISKVAKRVTLSHHLRRRPRTSFPENVNHKPDVKEFVEDGAVFEDGSFESYTVIFYCTGYKYTFPFLSIDCEISCEDNYVQPLYKHIININRPTMAFIGLPFYVCASQMFDLQTRFIVKFLSGAKALPSKEEMLRETEEEMQERWDKGYKKRQAHMMGPEQGKYYESLARIAEIDPIKHVMTLIHNESSQRFLDDLVNFRKERYRVIDDRTFIKLEPLS